MKKFYAIAATAVLLGATVTAASYALPELRAADSGSGAQTVPYTPVIGDGIASGEWTVVNHNEDTKVWQKSGTAAYLSYNSQMASDDYLISPAIHLEGGREYRLCYSVKGGSSSYREKMKVFQSTASDIESIQAGTLLKDYQDFWSSSYIDESFIIKPETDQDIYITFYACSDRDKMGLYVADFKVLENVFAPAAPTNLRVVRDPSREVKAILSWDLPTKDTFGATLTEEQPVEKVFIYRDGEERPIQELEGAVSTWTDTEETGLVAGDHSYQVGVQVQNALSPLSAAVTVKNVGPTTPKTVPATWAPETTEDFEDWTVIEGEGKTNTNKWVFSNWDKINYQSATDRSQDDWLICPPVKIEKAGYYKIDYTARTNMSVPQSLEVWAGTAPTVEGMTIKVTEDLKLIYNYNTFNHSDCVAKIDEPGVYYFALRAAVQEGATYGKFFVQSIDVTETSKTPAPVTDLKATPGADFAKSCTLDWTVPAKDATGGELSADEYDIEVYRSDKQEKLATLAGGSTSYEDTSIETEGLYTYTVKTVAKDGASVSSHPSVTSTWVGKPMVALPYATGFYSSDKTLGCWSILDAEDDSEGWYLDGDVWACKPGAKGEDGLFHYKDYLVSPYFDLEPGYYRLNFKTRGKVGQSYTVGLIDAGTATAERIDMSQAVTIETPGSSYTSKTVFFKIEEAGEYQIVWAVELDTDVDVTTSKWDEIRWDDIDFRSFPPLPADATDLTVTVGENEELTATLSWTNPATSNIPDVSPEVTEAKIYRDGKEVASVTEGLVDGEQASWTDTPEQGLTPGRHIYGVEIYNANGKGNYTYPTVQSEWIGGGLEMPFAVTGKNYEGPQYWNDWTIVNVDGDKGSWEDYSWIVNNTAMRANTENKANDWAISPRLNFKDGVVYKVTVQTYLGYGNDKYEGENGYPVDFYAGKGEYTAFGKVATLRLHYDQPTTDPDVMPVAYSASNPEIFTVYIKGQSGEIAADEAADALTPATAVAVPAGSGNVAFYVGTPGACSIFKMSIEEVSVLPAAHATDLAVVPDAEGALSAVFSWTNPAESSMEGMPLVLTEARIFRDGEQVATVTEGLVAGEQSSWTDTEEAGLTAGVHTYAVEVRTAHGAPEGEKPAVKSEWIGGALEMPYAVGQTDEEGARSWDEWSGAWTADENGLSAEGAAGRTLSPELKVESESVYKLTLRAFAGEEGYDLDVYAVQGDAAVKVATVSVNAGYTVDNPEEHVLYIHGVDTAEELVALADEADPEPTSPNADKAVAVPSGEIRLALDAAAAGNVTVKSLAAAKDGIWDAVSDAGMDASGIVSVVDGQLVFNGNASDIRVYDLSGKLVAADTDLRGLDAGFYIVAATVDGQNIILKIKL